jgi:uncharacterized protein (DUF697 family)
MQSSELAEFSEYESGEFEGESEGEFSEYESGEFEGEFEGEYESGGEFESQELAESEQFLGGILGSLAGGGELESPLSGSQEIELASELLEIGSEQELEQFLGNLVKGISRAVGGVIKSPVGRALGGVLKSVAKKALPVVGGALGSMVAPGIGTALGSKLGSMASGLFEVEFEALPAEAAEFEVARRYVNLAASAARRAALAQPRPGVNPQRVARAAVAAAARTYAPGVYRGMMQGLQGPGGARRAPGGRPGRPAMTTRYGAGWAPYRQTAGYPYRRQQRGGPQYRGYRGGRPGYRGARGRTGGRPAGGYYSSGRRRYGWGYGDWDAPQPWGDSWAEPAGYAGNGVNGDGGYNGEMSGRWARRGGRIVLFGA